MSRRAWGLVVAAVAALAFAARALQLVKGGGLAGVDGYDDSVYYAAATTLVHGRAPYDDFVLLHPPGLILALTPFAALARLTSDTIGQDAARVAFMAVGAVNTVIVMQVARRFGVWCGVAAGVTYALAYPAVYAERTTTLEALGTLTMLLALLPLVGPTGGRDGHWVGDVPGPSARRLVLAGAALGAGASVKIWNVVPLVVVLLWVLVAGSRRAAAWVAASAGVVATAICLPFFLHDPGQMWRYVVTDQVGRHRMAMTVFTRLNEITGLEYDLRHAAMPVRYAALALVLGAVAAAAGVALRTPGARVLVALLVAQGVLLIASPSFFLHYATLTAAPAAMLLGLGVERSRVWLAARRVPAAVPRVLAAGLAAALLAAMVPGLRHWAGTPFPRALAAAAERTQGCITADDPTFLIEMNVLSRDLDHGCRVWVDVTGLTYDRAGGGGPGVTMRRFTNRTWQRQVMGYLLSGAATVVGRPETDLNPAHRRQVRALPVIARVGGFALRQVR